MYRHTQVGYVTLLATIGATAAWLLAFGARVPMPRPVYVTTGTVLLLAGVFFSSLTIEVTDGELQSYFGPGFWRKRVRLADVAGAELASSQWWEGWGIRVTPRGMLYNVSAPARSRCTSAPASASAWAATSPRRSSARSAPASPPIAADVAPGAAAH